MVKAMSIIEVRNKLTSLPEDLQKRGEQNVVEVTRRGKPVMAVLSWEMYETIIETLEITSDPELVKELKKSIKELESGRAIAWDAAKKDLKL